jgi:hypothetical protein
MVTKQQMDAAWEQMNLHAFDYERWAAEAFGLGGDRTIGTVAREAFAKLDLNRMKADPLLQRFLRQTPWDTPFPIRAAWEAEAERLMYTVLLAEQKVEFNMGFDVSPDQRITSRLLVFTNMTLAVTYLWRTEILKKAESLPVPRHTIPENLLPFTSMYWSWEGARDDRVTNTETGEQFNIEADGMLVWYMPPGGIQAWSVGTGLNADGKTVMHAIQTAILRVGTTWPDDYSEGEQNTLSPLLAKLSFLNSPFVSAERERLPRPIRRALKKTTAADTEPPIHVVKLRQTSTPHGGAGATDRELRHQWWVRGHIRAQWFPSMKGHRLIWIREYLKGPSDAPIIRKIYDVQR